MPNQKNFNIQIPRELPFLQSVCWQIKDIRHLTLSEMLARYERGWNYRSILADLKGEERQFVRCLAKQYGSWIESDV